MVCEACGGQVEQEARFCPSCGTQVIRVAQAQAPYPTYAPYVMQTPSMSQPAQPRVARHLRTLGSLWCVLAALRLVEGLVGAFFVKTFVFGWHNGWPLQRHAPAIPPWFHLMPVILGFTIVAALFAAFVGWSLLERKSYARVLAMVAAVLILLKLPFGTALGIYTLWVLAPTESALEYDALAEP